MKKLQQKVQELEKIELKQMRSERKCRELERKLLHIEADQRIVSVSKQHLLDHQELIQTNKQLMEENSILR